MSVRKFVRSKRFLATLSLVTLMGSAGITGAPVANAAAASPGFLMGAGLSCLWPGTPTQVASTTVTGSVGDTFTVSMAFFCNTKTIVGNAGVATPSTGTIIASVSAVTFTIVGTGSFTLTGSPDALLTINIVVPGGASNQAAAATVVFPPPPPAPDKMQAVARPSTGCATFVSDASLNWDGVAGTGWGSSWAQWMNNGLGGDVCMRMLGYNPNTGKTVIR